jgi:hypothetical protein
MPKCSCTTFVAGARQFVVQEAAETTSFFAPQARCRVNPALSLNGIGENSRKTTANPAKTVYTYLN